MYNEYFGFSEAPFSIAPDPRYLYMSERHREALAHLLYGLKIDGGFVLLTGEVGTGKTTVCRCLLEQVPENCDIAFIVNPKLTTIELLRTICEELHIAVPSTRLSVKVFVDLINFHLLEGNARGRKTVLIVDEAQNLSNEVLEQLRLLTNLETNQRKLLQIILLGQPELRKRLAQPEMRQLAQRIVARYHLEPLSDREVTAYVGHRLAVAGARHGLFPRDVLKRLHRLTHGTPRLINVVCDRALLGAYVEGKPTIDVRTLGKAAREALGEEGLSGRSLTLRWALALGLMLTLALGAGLAVQNWQSDAPATPVPAPAAAAAAKVPDADGEKPKQKADADSGLLAWPAGKEHWMHEILAVRALYATLKLDLPPADIASACLRAPDKGLHCLEGKTVLDDLRLMKTPAILELRQPSGTDFYATLVGLDGSTAHLMIAGEKRDVDADVLARQWSGQFVLLWTGPTGPLRELGIGTRGPDVQWVAQRLARWEGTTDPAGGGELFDPRLRQRVLAFQRATGLEPDGVAGPLTMARLAIATPDGEAAPGSRKVQ